MYLNNKALQSHWSVLWIVGQYALAKGSNYIYSVTSWVKVGLSGEFWGAISMLMFRGVNSINMDVKGRLAVPARYRDAISLACDGQMVVTIDPDSPCLLLYPLPDWEEIQAKIERFPTFNKMARRMQRLLIGHANDIELDGNGRLLLPAPLREYASLDKKVVLLGQGKKFEIWDEVIWNKTRDEYLQEEDDGSLPPELLDFSL